MTSFWGVLFSPLDVRRGFGCGRVCFPDLRRSAQAGAPDCSCLGGGKKQIPFGNDNKKGKSDGKDKGKSDGKDKGKGKSEDKSRSSACCEG